MAERITIKNLRHLAARINAVTRSPELPWKADESGKMRAQVGNYHISSSYGGYCLHRMSNESGGVTTPLGLGHGSARELYERMHAFLRGIETGRELERADMIGAGWKSPLSR